ncbi:MAG: B12-binding domain-containing radical SAM protein [Treponema sp.]|nr:B12-binding domain-containing radical SAM protein [Treponema sp.]
MKEILLTTINAKWIHPSLALRLLKANLGSLQDNCEIIEFALRQPLGEKMEPFLEASPRILGISVSIWNHTSTIEFLENLERLWQAQGKRPVVVLGGPEVSHLPLSAEIFRFADFVIRGEGEIAFRTLCESVLVDRETVWERKEPKFIDAEPVNLSNIKSAYYLYADEDLAKKLIYVEATRGCQFNCEFCLTAVKSGLKQRNTVREFPLDQFLAEMDALIRRGAKTFKFLDRTFNFNIKRALRICEFFLEKIKERGDNPLVVHFEMVPSLFPDELREVLIRFPPGTLRLEVGIQTLNAEVSARISRPSNPQKELETLRFLRENTNAIIHADLIAGLPGEDLASFGEGFDRLWSALCETGESISEKNHRTEIQLGILKLLTGAPISRHSEKWRMRYNRLPPYEIEETSSLSPEDIGRIKNFARFWELIVNRSLIDLSSKWQVFNDFMTLSDTLLAHFGRNWGLDKAELLKKVLELTKTGQLS